MLMTTPTNMTEDWIKSAVAKVPFVELEAGNVRTCPLRLSFPYLQTPQKAMEAGKPDKYTATGLYPCEVDDGVLKAVAMRAGAEKWGDQFTTYAAGANFHNPFKDQKEKERFQGYVPGLRYFTASGERKPSVVMQNTAPYTGKVYPGLWACLIVRPFAFETRNAQNIVVKRGIGMGLQSVMILADDVEWGEGAPIDVAKAFAGVSLDANLNVSEAFGTGATAEAQAAPAANPFG